MAKRGANSLLMSKEPLTDTDIANDVTDLILAKEDFHSADSIDQEALDKKRDEIRRLQAEERDILLGRKSKKAEAEARGIEKARRIAEKMADSEHDVHPLYRAALEAPLFNGGSLWELDTAVAADALGRGLVSLDRYLSEQDDSLPVITVSDNQKPLESYRELQVNYGFTSPNSGLIYKTEDIVVTTHSSGQQVKQPQPFIEIPTTKEPALEAVMSPSWNSHILRSSGKIMEIHSHGTKKKGKIRSSEAWPAADELALPLPIGNLSLREESKPLVVYDNRESDIEAVVAPRSFSGRPEAVAYIGQRAVKTALLDLYRNSEARGQNPEVIKNMALIAMASLGIHMKRSKFGRIQPSSSAP